MSSITKLYAAYKAGYLGDNILDTYFSFIANIIAEKHITVVEDTHVAALFKERYDIELPLPLLRQVLGVGVDNKCFVEDHGKYGVEFSRLSEFRFDETDFNKLWEQLNDEFKEYCEKNEVDITSSRINEFILNVLNVSDEKILAGEKIEEPDGMPAIEYAWYSFIREQGETKTELYSFVAALSASNITKQALFYNGESEADYSDLNVYLDSPIIFALLGMDEKSRTESYKTLVEDMKKAKCNIHVLDHNYQEVENIISSAATWATNIQYDLRKANNATRFFHDSQMTKLEIAEFCANIETTLNGMGVTVKKQITTPIRMHFKKMKRACLTWLKSDMKSADMSWRRKKNLAFVLTCARL